MERVLENENYFVIPGGQMEAGETLEQTAVREAFEEEGLVVGLGSLAAHVEFPNRTVNRTQYYFWAEITGGVFGTGKGEELMDDPESDAQGYRAVWMKITDLEHNDVRPRELAQALHKDTIKPGGAVLEIAANKDCTNGLYRPKGQ